MFIVFVDRKQSRVKCENIDQAIRFAFNNSLSEFTLYDYDGDAGKIYKRNSYDHDDHKLKYDLVGVTEDPPKPFAVQSPF